MERGTEHPYLNRMTEATGMAYAAPWRCRVCDHVNPAGTVGCPCGWDAVGA